MILGSEDVLFVGRGIGAVPWYRTGMPALHLGCDWVGLDYKNLEVVASLKRGGHGPVSWDKYKIIVLQQPSGRRWLEMIRDLQRSGKKVIYEVDDYLHGVGKLRHHRNKKAFTKEKLREYELCMSVCDAMICSTEWLAKRYRKFNANVYVCRNGVDTRLYEYELPERKSLNIGWAGGEGHVESFKAWMPAIEKILDEFDHVRFISIGLPVANLFKRPDRCFAIPFLQIENFPAAMTNFDIGVAPAGRSNFFAAKSDLRFLETGALGIPLVADPFVYSDIDDGITGLWAETVDEVHQALHLLVSEEGMRKPIGADARSYIRRSRDIKVAIEQWEEVFPAVWDA
jgi:glycosyltransferase involved in cell wall biosynthesis